MQQKSKVAEQLKAFAEMVEDEAANFQKFAGRTNLSAPQDQALDALRRAATQLTQASDSVLTAESARDITFTVDATDRLDKK